MFCEMPITPSSNKAWATWRQSTLIGLVVTACKQPVHCWALSSSFGTPCLHSKVTEFNSNYLICSHHLWPWSAAAKQWSTFSTGKFLFWCMDRQVSSCFPSIPSGTFLTTDKNASDAKNQLSQSVSNIICKPLELNTYLLMPIISGFATLTNVAEEMIIFHLELDFHLGRSMT